MRRRRAQIRCRGSHGASQVRLPQLYRPTAHTRATGSCQGGCPSSEGGRVPTRARPIPFQTAAFGLVRTMAACMSVRRQSLVCCTTTLPEWHPVWQCWGGWEGGHERATCSGRALAAQAVATPIGETVSDCHPPLACSASVLLEAAGVRSSRLVENDSERRVCETSHRSRALACRQGGDNTSKHSLEPAHSRRPHTRGDGCEPEAA